MADEQKDLSPADRDAAADRQRMRVLWHDSAERKRVLRDISYASIFSVILLAGGSFWLGLNQDSFADAAPWLWITLLALVYLAVGALVIYYQARARLFVVRIDLGLDQEIRDREQALADSGESIDFASIWSLTQARIEYYHRIATRQSSDSFRNGAIASGAGFLFLLAVGVAAAFLSHSTESAITLGALGVVGAALSGFLSATYMKAQSEASAQLREFFRQPVEFAQMLGAERLIDKLPVDERADAVKLVVKAMMQTPKR